MQKRDQTTLHYILSNLLLLINSRNICIFVLLNTLQTDHLVHFDTLKAVLL